MLGVNVGTASVHLHVCEESAIRLILVDHRVSAEKDAGVVLHKFGLNAYLTPPVADEGLGILPDNIGRGLVGNPQGNAVVFAYGVSVGVEDIIVVQQPVGSFDVLGQAFIVCG